MNNIITCSEWIDINESDINEYIQESYWSEDFSVEVLEKILIEMAKDDGIILSDLDSFDWDKELRNIYQWTEKGLS